MVQIAAIHNGSTNLPTKRTEDGSLITDASLREVHQDCQQLVKDQIEHGVKAEQHGFDRIFFTEHHFELTAAEFSPNPMMSQMAIASQTEDIKLCQGTNIITWHDPVRFAEQAAMLDILSDGRAEIGVGRGYQPRENEVLGGQYWGGTIQDQEKNRASFEEKFEIIKKAWTEDLFSHQGEFHTIPPSYTKWHHDHEKAFLESDVTEYEVDDVMDWKNADYYSSDLWNSVVSGGSTLKSLSVFPQPMQEPYPQLWQPVSTYRSCDWAAQNGVNGMTFAHTEGVRKNLERYYSAAEEAGWPDRRPEYDGEPFRHGWDEERERGFITGRWIFNTEVGDDETFEKWKQGVEHTWDFFGPFGFTAPITGDPEQVPTAEELEEKGVIIAGDTDHIVDRVLTQAEMLGYEEHFNFAIFFETSGVSNEKTNKQLEAFGEKVLPHLEEEYPSP
ncbi:LLM class flavin-dependent oxidoreductase [Halosolutus amylolyticus]|uniref:LLM class flavin-dependent oxidoreductase n=1 Tax=Halosolutus amylolyticus TaxID=2932267 RepID=A0ABD5PJ44_9EURY|nr:LLM class flavin-dependent oxidoreductase [Halosolutus amylolyticus]